MYYHTIHFSTCVVLTSALVEHATFFCVLVSFSFSVEHGDCMSVSFVGRLQLASHTTVAHSLIPVFFSVLLVFQVSPCLLSPQGLLLWVSQCLRTGQKTVNQVSLRAYTSTAAHCGPTEHPMSARPRLWKQQRRFPSVSSHPDIFIPIVYCVFHFLVFRVSDSHMGAHAPPPSS